MRPQLFPLLALLVAAPLARSATLPPDLSQAQLEVPPGRLLVNLMMEGRLAWFTWMNQPALKPKLVVEWKTQGRTHTKTWQHGVDGSIYPQTIFLVRGNQPGHLRWGGHADVERSREGHKHHFFSKDRSPARCGFVKADLSEIPADAAILRAELILHIHDSEGLKAGPEPELAGAARFRHVHHEWDWDHVSFTHYAENRTWLTPTGTYPFLGAGDVSKPLWTLDRQKDLAASGFHKRGNRDYPLDLTAYVARLQQLRSQPPAVRTGPLPGQIVVDPENPQWLKRHGGDPVFICGPGDPEGFLYRGTRRPDGTRDGDQLALIDKLARHGGNSIYLQLVRSHGGDAKDDSTQNPFVDSDPAKGLDPRILDQWEQWFTRMDEQGILIYLFFYDDSARIWHTGDAVGPEEKKFLEAIVAKFRHHRNLIWVFGEESEERYTRARVNAAAAVIRAADPHGHLIGDHHHSGPVFKSWEKGSALNHYSMQLNVPLEGVHAGALEARRLAGGRYQVIYAENTAMPKDVVSMRRHMWSVALAGVMPMLYQMEIADTPVESLEQCRHLQGFFEATDFPTMDPHDELAHAGTKYVLADPGRSYIAYADTSAPTLGLKSLPAGACEITWLDCVTGRTDTVRETVTAGDREFARPDGYGPEIAAWIRFAAIPRRPRAPVDASAAPERTPGPNRAPVTSDHTFATHEGAPVYVQLRFQDDDGPGPYTYTIVAPPKNGTLSGDDNDRTYTPAAGFTGRDFFTWRVHDGAAQSAIGRVNLDVIAGTAVASSATYFPPPESQGGWRQLATPDEVRRIGGMDPDKLAALEEWLRASDQRDFAAVVIRHGQVVLQVERGNSAVTDSRRVASVSKAICAAVLAIASERSQQGLTPHRMKFDDPAFQFIPWAQPLSDPRKERITLRQIFDHTSGISPEANGARNTGTWDYYLGHSGDARTAQLAFDPGTGCGYSTIAIYHASLVCEYVTGQPYDRFAIEQLFQPLGCEHWWFHYSEGAAGKHPTHNLGLPARDIARVAYCMLQGGRWGDRQVIPAWFVDGVNQPAAPTGIKELRWGFDSSFYVLGWSRPRWLSDATAPGVNITPPDARQKHGSGGQYIAYVPSLDLILTRQTGGSGTWDYEEFLARACAAVIR